MDSQKDRKYRKRNSTDIVWESNRLLNVIPDTEGRECEKGIFKNILVEWFTEMMKDTKLQIKEPPHIIFEKFKNNK